MKPHFLMIALFLSLFACQADEHPDSSVKGAYLASYLWKKKTISVCFLPNPNLSASDRQSTQVVVNSTWVQYINLRFTGWGDCTGSRSADITIDMGTHITRAMSEIGSYGTFVYPSMKLYSSNSSYSRDRDYFAYVIVHEFGHALGITHEHQRPDHPLAEEYVGCRGPQSNIESITTRVGAYDSKSIMNYCISPYKPVLSAGDIRTIQTMYPR